MVIFALLRICCIWMIYRRDPCVALTKMGPVYMKFGQFLSTRPDIIGHSFANKLKDLQDKVAPSAKDYIEQTLLEELGENFNKSIQISHPSIASGSIAQVHLAKIDNQDYAIKILHKNIEKKYRNDIRALMILGKTIDFLFKKTKRIKLPSMVANFEKTAKMELDMRIEAANICKMSAYTKCQSIRIPKVLWHYTTRRILVTEMIEGFSLYDKDSLNRFGIRGDIVAQNLAKMFFEQTYEHGFFHADIHPGNIIITKSGEIGLVDFGIVGTLNKLDRIAIAEIIYAVTKKDYDRVALVHLKAGYIPKDTNLEHFAQRCRAVTEPIFGASLKEMSICNFIGKLIGIFNEFDIETQPQLLLLHKSMISIEGVVMELDHDVNMWNIISPWIEKWAMRNLSIEARVISKVKDFVQSIL